MDIPTSNIAIILVNWNGTQDTLECLASLQNVKQPFFDCLVVDNASNQDPETKIKEAFPEIIYFGLDKNLGFAGGNNIAIEYSIKNNYEFILLLNNDTIVEPDFLAQLVDCLKNNCKLQAVQPLIYNNSYPKKIWSTGGIWNNWIGDSFTIKKNPSQSNYTNRDWLTGCAMLIRTSVLKDVGAFNENLFAYYEDVDLSFRINKRGNTLAVVPASIIYHKVSASVNASAPNREGRLNPLVHYWNARNRLWLIKKYQPWYTYPTIFIAVTFYYSIVLSYLLLRGRYYKCKMICKGLSEGYIQNLD